MSGTTIPPAGSDLAKHLDSNSGSVSSGGYSFGPAYQPAPNAQATQPVMIQPRGALAGIVADAIVRESGRDTLQLTDSPVEKSADITDHAFLRPVEMEVELGFSNSGNGFGYAAAAYAAVLNLQALRTPFSFTTGKRLYRDMLIVSVGQTTEDRTENSLILHVGMRQVILVSTQAASLPPMERQAMPEQTADTTNTGQKQPAAVPAGQQDTILNSLAGNGGGYIKAGSQ